VDTLELLRGNRFCWQLVAILELRKRTCHGLQANGGKSSAFVADDSSLPRNSRLVVIVCDTCREARGSYRLYCSIYEQEKKMAASNNN
jgi:hypothetical protein